MKEKVQYILSSTVINIFGRGKNKSSVLYSTKLIDFFTKMPIKNKTTIEKLREINFQSEKLAKKYKFDNLISATISATFVKNRLLWDIKDYTGIIVIDIDKDKNEGLDVEKAKKDIMTKHQSSMLAMTSCRGEGLFVLIYYNKENNFKDTYNALYDDFLEMGYIIDNCKDETRLRYISYDDNILIKNEVERYEKTKHIEIERNNNYDPEGDEWIMTKDDVKDIIVAIYALVNFHGYTADDYDAWLLEGFRLATLPNKEVGLKLFQMISEKSDNYEGPNDVKEKFEECLKTTTYKTNILGYYINKIRDYYGYDWRYRVSDLLKERGIYVKT